MRFCVLGSGSGGNATFVEADSTAILIDAGFSGKEIERRLGLVGVDPARISAILVTHEHGDHVCGVGVLARRYHLPVYIAAATLGAAPNLGKLPEVRHITPGRSFQHKSLTIHPFATAHDAADPLGYVVNHKGTAFGYCTDTGLVSKLIRHRLAGCHGLVLEANHDAEMLKNGPYAPALKQRIASKTGHLANHQAAGLLRELATGGNLAHVVLAHLSGDNNHPDKVIAAIAEIIGNGPPDFSIASQDTVGEMIHLS